MAGKTAAQEISERKRISIPKADESVLQWWNEQHDPGLSIRTLVRAEIERSGYVDSVYRPVSQQPRRGRPPGSATDFDDTDDQGAPVAPVVTIPTHAPAPVRDVEPVAAGSIPSAIDSIMNG
jgi:hypothetical protein